VFGDAGLLANAADERSAYEAAFAALRAGDYPQSARLFSEFLRLYPTGSYAPNATYWLGESYYVTQDYASAQAQFQAILQRWPTHDKAPGALLKVGLSQYGRRDLVAAQVTLTRVTEQYPGTDAARTADDRLRSIQLNSLR
jgi:tol-pal system protein YbgF